MIPGDRRRDYSSSSFSDSPSPRRKPERRKSLGEHALAALGVGGAAGALAGKHDRDRDRDRDRHGGRRRRDSSYSSDSGSRSRSGPGLDQAQIMKAAKAALLAGATEAFRSRKEPGGWGGPKGKRVLTAAIGAGGIDGLLQGGNKDGKSGGTFQTIQSVVGGLAGNRLINGKRDKSESRSRSRSRGGRRRDDSRGGGGGGGGGGGLAGLAAGGLAAAAGKALMDRGKSKDRGRGRRYSSSDDDRGGRGKRSKSVSDFARQGMAALGIGGDKGKNDRGSHRGYDDDYVPRPRGGGGESGDGVSSMHGSQSSSEDDVSSSEEERERKKMGHKQLITAGLASVATIHAGQSVYKSIEGRRRHAAEVASGEMTPEEARKKKNKARLQDAAAIGIAALGIKGAYSEWKEMKEQREEVHEFDIKRAERHARREQRAIDAEKWGQTEIYENGQDQYHASAPNLSAAAPYPSMQNGMPDGGTSPAPQSVYSEGGRYYGAPSGPAAAGPYYTDGNPYHSGGVPPPPVVP